MQLIFPKPKCKFGRFDMVVDATYVFCVTNPTPTENREARHREKVIYFKYLCNLNYLFRTILAFNAIIVQSQQMPKSFPFLFL
jgi:hypothetical protein